jgi:putative hydrolase of the HAD superfamily
MTFLFDIGNVLLKLHFDRFHTAVLGAPDTPLPPALLDIRGPYEAGEIDDHQFVNHSLEHLPVSLTPEQFTAAWQDIFTANEPMWEVVRQLKQQGHRLILFSNTNNLHTTSFLKRFQGFDHFDHHHFSQEVKAMKPERAFYQKAIEQYQLDPAETIYLDDLAENITTGREFGFACWQYDLNEHPACLEWLASRGLSLESNG